MKTLFLFLCLSLLCLTSCTSVSVPKPLTMEEEALRWGEEFGKADTEMNQVYQKLLASRNTSSQMKLRAAQRAWIAFRDAEAEFVRQDWEGGSGQTAAVNSVLATLTQDRVRELKDRF